MDYLCDISEVGLSVADESRAHNHLESLNLFVHNAHYENGGYLTYGG